MAVLAPVVSNPVWPPVKVFLMGASLAPGRRTVTAVLRVLGCSTAPHVQRSHRGLHRAVWSPLTARRRRFVAMVVPGGVVVCGLDDPSARGRGAPLRATGRAREPGRASHAPGVQVRGGRGRCWRRLTPMTGAGRVGARPWMTVRCPAARVNEPQGRHHPPRVARAWQLSPVGGRWWPRGALGVGADRRDAVLAGLHQVRAWPRARLRTRRRREAARAAPPPARAPGPIGRPRLTGARRPTLEAV
jgi:hypothetical protein